MKEKEALEERAARELPSRLMDRRARRADKDIKNLLANGGDDPREAMALAEEWDIGYYDS